jgi:hypothetical protein
VTDFSGKMRELSKELHNDYIRVAYHLTELYMSFEMDVHINRAAGKKALISLLHMHQISQELLDWLHPILENTDFEEDTDNE